MISSYLHSASIYFFFFFNDTATTEIYTLSLHDALPISNFIGRFVAVLQFNRKEMLLPYITTDIESYIAKGSFDHRSEEHTSELQSQSNLVCRLLLEKKKDYARAQASPELLAITLQRQRL